MTTLIPIVIFIFILGIVIFVHELGHYLAARRAGVFVEEFALGMGPRLFSFRGKPEAVGGGLDSTIYALRMFPIGGFCKMRGQDEDAPEADVRALNNKSVPKRMLVMAGGSLMNFLLAFILFFVLTLLTGYRVANVRGVVENSPAHTAGLQAGDRITHINGNRVTLYENFLLQLEFSMGEPMDVRIVRDGTRHHLEVTPFMTEQGDFRMGFFPDLRFGLLDSAPEGFSRVRLRGSLVTSAEMMLFNIRLPFTLLTRWVNNQTLPAGADVMGPIGMAGEMTQLFQHVSAAHGALDTALTMTFFAAVLSAALGLFNLLPIPAMDGARLVFLFIEGIRKKPVPPEREGMVHLVGFALLIALAIFIAFRDIVRLIS